GDRPPPTTGRAETPRSRADGCRDFGPGSPALQTRPSGPTGRLAAASRTSGAGAVHVWCAHPPVDACRARSRRRAGLVRSVPVGARRAGGRRCAGLMRSALVGARQARGPTLRTSGALSPYGGNLARLRRRAILTPQRLAWPAPPAHTIVGSGWAQS